MRKNIIDIITIESPYINYFEYTLKSEIEKAQNQGYEVNLHCFGTTMKCAVIEVYRMIEN